MYKQLNSCNLSQPKYRMNINTLSYLLLILFIFIIIDRRWYADIVPVMCRHRWLLLVLGPYQNLFLLPRKFKQTYVEEDELRSDPSLVLCLENSVELDLDDRGDWPVCLCCCRFEIWAVWPQRGGLVVDCALLLLEGSGVYLLLCFSTWACLVWNLDWGNNMTFRSVDSFNYLWSYKWRKIGLFIFFDCFETPILLIVFKV